MFYAINSNTLEKVNSLAIEFDSSYLLKDDEVWYADPNNIESCPKDIDINKIVVKFRRGCEEKINKFGTVFSVTPCWFIPNKEKLGINLIPETKEHILAKNFIYNELKNNSLVFKYSSVNKPEKYDNIITLSDMDIDYNKIGTEIIVSNGVRQIADVIIPFKKFSQLFGTGIIMEIQFSKQYDETTNNRTVDWAIKGYSVVWLWYYDFGIIDDLITLNKRSINLDAYNNILKKWNEEINRNMLWQTQKLSRMIDTKINEFNEKCEDMKKNKTLFIRHVPKM